MRLFTIFFVFVFLFTSSMSYAIAFAPAVKVVIGTTVMTKGVEWGTQMGKAGYNYCKANKSKCKDWFGDVVDIFLGDDDDGSCVTRFSFRHYERKQTASGFYFSSLDRYKLQNQNHEYKPSPNWQKHFDDAIEATKNKKSSSKDWVWFRTFYVPYYEIMSEGGYEYPRAMTVNLYKKCDISDDEKRQYEDERFSDFFDRIKDRLDRDKEEEILNHPSNQPIIKKYCEGFGACIEMEMDFKKEYEKNKDDYDPDKFDEKTCKMRNGKIQSCDGAKKKKDGSDGSTGTDDKDKKDDEDSDDKDKDKKDDEDSDDKDKDKKDDGGDGESAKCKDTDLTKELCEFLDWVDDEAKEPKNTKVEIDDDKGKTRLDDDLINVLKNCPADIEFSVRMLGQSMNFEVDTMPFCLVSQKVRPYIVGAGTLSAIFILAGVRRE